MNTEWDDVQQGFHDGLWPTCYVTVPHSHPADSTAERPAFDNATDSASLSKSGSTAERTPPPPAHLHAYTCAYCTGDGIDRPDFVDRDDFEAHMAHLHHGLPFEFRAAHPSDATAAPGSHRIEWAVASDDGSIYEVEGKTREKAEAEAALLRQPDEDGYSEPGAHVVMRKVCEWVSDLSSTELPPVSHAGSHETAEQAVTSGLQREDPR